MLGRGKQKPGKQKATPAPPPRVPAEEVPVARPVVVAVLFESESVSLETIEPALARQTILGQRVVASLSGRTGEESASFSAEVGGAIIAGMVMPAPYPIADLEFAIASAWTWPPDGEATAVNTAESHVLVVVTGGNRTAIENHLIATKVATMVASLPGACAVYWPAGNVVHHPAVFAGLAETASPDRLPLYLWSNYCVVPEGEVSSLFTVGLEPLGLMEIEVHGVRKTPMELREWASSLVDYQLVNRPVFAPGDTVGESADAQLRVSHAESSFGLPSTVMRMDAV